MARPRHNAPRYRCGKLKRPRPARDTGSDQLYHHRAQFVGLHHARDPRASYPLGILFLQGDIPDALHSAGLRYAWLNTVVWDHKRSPESCLATLVPSPPDETEPTTPDQRERWRAAKGRELNAAVTALQRLPTSRPFRVLQDVVVYQHMPRFLANGAQRRNQQGMRADHANHTALHQALTQLAQLWGIQ